MKKKYAICILLFVFLLVACGETDHANEITTTIKGGRTGGAWAVFTEGVAESIRREHEDAYITVEPGSIVENPPMVGTGTVPYGVSYAMTSYAAYMGEEPYPESFEDIRAVSVIIPANYFQFIITDTLPFDSLPEIIEEEYPIRLGVNQKGSDAERITRELLRYYGVTYDDIKSWGGSIDYLSSSKAFELMADGRIDAFGNAESAPSSNILEASTTTDLNMISFDEATTEAVARKLGMETNTVKAQTYSFLANDITTVSTPAILITHKDIPEEEVYAVTKSIYNNLDYLQIVHEEFKALTKETMMHVGEVPLHPGAEQFFKDEGLID